MISIYPYFLYSLKIWCLRNVQNFIEIPWGVLILSRQSTNFLITPRIYICIEIFLLSIVLILILHSMLKRLLKCMTLSYLYYLAHLSWKLKWAFLITCRPSSVCPSVRPSVCLSVRPSVCKLFTFSSSSPELLGQFQPNLAQSILGWRGFKFVQMKGHTLPKGEIIGN